MLHSLDRKISRRCWYEANRLQVQKLRNTGEQDDASAFTKVSKLKSGQESVPTN